MSVFDVTVPIRTRGGIALARLIVRLAPILGVGRALRWAQRAYYWRVRMRIASGPWQRCSPP